MTLMKSGKKVEVDMAETSTTLDVKKMIHKLEGIPSEAQTLIYAGCKLPDDCVFMLEKNIQRDSNIFVAIALNCEFCLSVHAMVIQTCILHAPHNYDLL